MDNKILVAIIAAIAIVGGACGAVLLLGNGGDKSIPGLLNIEAPGTYENGTYDTVIICASVGDGDVLLKNIKIVKELIIRGGGSHSVTLDGCTNEGTTTVEKESGEDVRINLVNTTLPSVTATSNVILEADANSNFESVNMNGNTATVQGEQTKVENMNLSAGSSLNVTDGSVGSVSMTDGCNLKVEDGAVDSVNVAKDSSVGMEIGTNGSVDNLVVGDNVAVTTTGDDTAAKLEETNLKMADDTTTSGVIINDTPQHVHKYQLLENDVDWTHFDKIDMTVPATITCSTCQNPQEGHSYPETLSVSATRVEPTCTADGSVTYAANWGKTVVEYATKDVLPMLGHEYTVQFTWASDYATATYVAVCTHDSSHTETGSANVQVQTTPATCTADGSSVYTASVTLADGNHSDQKTVVLSKSHQYQLTSVNMASAQQDSVTQVITVEATLTCSVCSEDVAGHSITERLQAKDEGTFVEPNCGQGIDGSLTITLLYNGEEYVYSDTLPAVHHYMVDPTVGIEDREHPTITLICTSCLGTVDNLAATPVITDRVEPKCVEAGSYKYHAECTYEGTVYRSLEETIPLPNLGHEYEYNFVWADDNSSATLVIICARDGCEFRDEIEARVSSEIITPATCEAGGQTQFHAICYLADQTPKEDTKVVDTAVLGHDYELGNIDWNTLNTETKKVSATFVCKNNNQHTEIRQLDVQVDNVPAKCSEAGYNHYYVPNTGDNGHRIVIPATGHSLQHHDAQAATCTEAGWAEYDTCENCDYSTKQEIPALNHDYRLSEVQWGTFNEQNMTVSVKYVCSRNAEHIDIRTMDVLKDVTAPQCTVAGNTHYYVPNLADEGYDVAIPALEHDLIHHDGKAATCTEAGWGAYDTCSRCNYTTYNAIPAPGHSFQHHDAQAATLESAGWEAYDECTVCHVSDKVEIPRLNGYDVKVYGGKVAKTGQEFTVSEMRVAENTVVNIAYDGEEDVYWTNNLGDIIPGRTFIALVKSNLYYTPHPAEDKSYGEWVKTQPTCTTGGIWYRESTDGLWREYITVPAYGHVLNPVFTVTEEPTCTEEGVGYRVCKICGEHVEETIPALGHDYCESQLVQNPNGATPGKMQYECSVCGDQTVRDYYAPTYFEIADGYTVHLKWSDPNSNLTRSNHRDEYHTAWTIDDNGTPRDAYLYCVNRYADSSVTSWFLWVDHGVHTPVYVARVNSATEAVYETWSVAGYVDNKTQFIDFIDNLYLGMDNGRNASVLFDLYSKWTDKLNNGTAEGYESISASFRGVPCTNYWDDYEGFYVDANNCCLRWAEGVGNYADILQICEYTAEEYLPFVNGYVPALYDNEELHNGVNSYFNTLPTLESVSVFCITLYNGTYASDDYRDPQVRYYNGDDLDYLMQWGTPDVDSHMTNIRFEVRAQDGTWYPVPTTTYQHAGFNGTYYGFDLDGIDSIRVLYQLMVQQHPDKFVMPNDPEFNGIYLRFNGDMPETDSNLMVVGGNLLTGMYGTGEKGYKVYGGDRVELSAPSVEGKTFDHWDVAIGGVTTVWESDYYTVPASTDVTITAVYNDLPTYHITFLAGEGGAVSGWTGDYCSESEVTVIAIPEPGYVFIGWYENEEDYSHSNSRAFTLYPWDDATYTAKFQAVTLEEMTKVVATNGFVQADEVGGIQTSVYAEPDFGTQVYGWANPELAEIHRWDIKKDAEFPESETSRAFPEDFVDYPFNIKYAGELTTVVGRFTSEIQFYNVTENLNDGSAPHVTRVAEDREYFTPETPTREGYDFINWNTSEDGTGTGYDAGTNIELEGDLTLYAKWQIKSKAITLMGPSNAPAPYTFDVEKKNISVRWGETVNVPADVIAVYGCTLIGWDIVVNGETQRIGVTGAIPYEADAIVRAVVGNFDEYRIHFVGGEVTPDNTMEDIVFTAEDIQSLKISWSSSINFKKTGYTLTEWTCDVDGDAPTKTSLSVSNRMKAVGYEHGGTFTLTAQWTKVNYIIQYKAGTAPAGATVLGFGEKANFVCDDSFTFTMNPSKIFTCTGYTLAGFNTSSGMTVFLYEYGQTVDTNVLLSDQRLNFESADGGMMEVLYPVWAKNSYTVYFYPEQGSNDHYDQQMTYGSSTELAAASTMGAAFQREGCTFVGWMADDGRTFDDQQSVKNLALTGSISLYAIWVHNTYTVHFDKNAQDAAGEMVDQTFSVNETKGLTPNAFAREGYVFVRWCTSEYNQGEYYTDGQSVSNLTTEESITLYAIWGVPTFEIPSMMMNDFVGVDLFLQSGDDERTRVQITQGNYPYNIPLPNPRFVIVDREGATAYKIADDDMAFMRANEPMHFRLQDTHFSGMFVSGSASYWNITYDGPENIRLWNDTISETDLVVYEGNGGAYAVDETQFVDDVVTSLRENMFTIAPAGKVFSGWNTKADGSGDPVAVGSTEFKHGVLYAIWVDE